MMESSAPVAPLAPDVLDPRRWWALALLCGAFFMVILDGTITIVALPSIGADLRFSEQGLQWVLSAYALTFGGLLLLGGRAADLLGRRRVFMAGVLLSPPRRSGVGSPGRRPRSLPPASFRAPTQRS
jgi:MFS family permease